MAIMGHEDHRMFALCRTISGEDLQGAVKRLEAYRAGRFRNENAKNSNRKGF